MALSEEQWLRRLRADLNADEALELMRLEQQLAGADEQTAAKLNARIDEIILVATP